MLPPVPILPLASRAGVGPRAFDIPTLRAVSVSSIAHLRPGVSGTTPIGPLPFQEDPRASYFPPAGCVIRYIEPAAHSVDVMPAPLRTVISFGFFGISGLFLLLSALYVAAYGCSDLGSCPSPIPGHLLFPAGLFLVAGILLLRLSPRPLPSAR